ncbi:NYN domain-containing protein [Porphyrobacter sp. SLTP]|uniref:NYN domain-containing protein n=1 Tax=Porphyrobacter sp. SLTP TaxID=2683266 RepID=UPI001412A148|nr:NYN domain-containing protein [Porphyrobacter sp. SLTP]NBB26566.1 NYN domain-containing protein [Porphyrobacter sp. SLTP]
MEVKYLFIDGGCLRATLKKVSERYFDGRELRINFTQLRGNHIKAFYYDAIPAMKPKETELEYTKRVQPRVELHNHIATLAGFHVYEGDSRIRRNQVQQKEVDVMIAVDMLTHTFRGNMERATFIASDIDFKPLLDALVREGMFVQLMYPPSDTNQALINAADARTPLAIDTIYGVLDRESQALLTLPSRNQWTAHDFDHTGSVEIARHETYGEVRYRRVAEEHSVYWASPTQFDHILEVRCPNYETIRKYVEDLYLIRLPDDEPREALV